MISIEPFNVARKVQDLLREMGSPASKVRVLADEVSPAPGTNCWYVPVSVHRDPENMAMIYDAFSQVEERLEEQESMYVLLVPRIIPFQRWADIA